MGIKADILRLFERVLQDHRGNKNAAARALGVGEVTFWTWIKNWDQPSRNDALFKAIDNSGAKLSIPGEHNQLPVNNHTLTEVEQLRHQLAEKDKVIKSLEEYRYKWIGHLETESARSGNLKIDTGEGIRGSIQKNSQPSPELKAKKPAGRSAPSHGDEAGDGS